MKTFNKEDATLRERIKEAFKTLRKEGFIARMDFLCCQSCAGYQIATDAAVMVKAGKKVNGCVYYHHQDADSLNQHEPEVLLAFGQIESNELRTIGMSTGDVGGHVVTALEAVGCTVEWDGNPGKRILVK